MTASMPPVPRPGPGSGVRVGDAEREAAADALRRHFAAGRLSRGELEERAARVWTARDRRDLRRALAGLPAEHGRRALQAAYRMQRRALPFHAAAWAALNGTSVGVWELAGGGAFWPAVVLVPSSLVLGAHGWGSRRLRRRLGR